MHFEVCDISGLFWLFTEFWNASLEQIKSQLSYDALIVHLARRKRLLEVKMFHIGCLEGVREFLICVN